MPDSSASDRRGVLTADTTLDAERRQIEIWRVRPGYFYTPEDIGIPSLSECAIS